MKKVTNIKDGLKVKEVVGKNRTAIFVIDDDKEFLLSDIETDEYFWNRWICDDNYIVAYSRGCMVNQMPLNIEGAYSIKNRKCIDVSSDKIKLMLEYMLISKRIFSLESVLSEINTSDLKLPRDDEKNELKEFLTLGNENISQEVITNYILRQYRELEPYTNLDSNLSLKDFNDIKEKLANKSFWFNAIPQNIDNVCNQKRSVYDDAVDIEKIIDDIKIKRKTKNKFFK